MSKKVIKTDEEWRAQLDPLQFEVTRKQGTERGFTGKYWDNHEDGIYRCVCCGQVLFTSDTKFDSGTGWPSFFAPVAKDVIALNTDKSHGMTRTEAVCSQCDAHLGHVFPDGPKPSRLRFCMNSASLDFTKAVGEDPSV
jgi:peptide-methionine (R)-S-oxide reductase